METMVSTTSTVTRIFTLGKIGGRSLGGIPSGANVIMTAFKMGSVFNMFLVHARVAEWQTRWT